jgi:hypothetical protein
MLTETTRRKADSLYKRASLGDLSNGSDLSRMMFLSLLDKILSEEKKTVKKLRFLPHRTIPIVSPKDREKLNEGVD